MNRSSYRDNNIYLSLSKYFFFFRLPTIILSILLLMIGCEDIPYEKQKETQGEGVTCNNATCIIQGGAFCKKGHPDVKLSINYLVAKTKNAPSDIIRIAPDTFLIVESLNNSISKLHNGKITPFADVGLDRDPYSIVDTGDEIWVPNYLSNSVSVINKDTGAILDEIRDTAFKGPSAIAYLDPWIFVSNVNYQYALTPPYGEGSVTVINKKTRKIIKTIPTKKLNPTSFQLVTKDKKKELIVVNAGAIIIGRGKGAYSGSQASIEIWDLSNGLDSLTKRSIDLPFLGGTSPLGAPNSPMLIGSTVYFSSSLAPVLFQLSDTHNVLSWIHSSKNPLVFDPKVSFGSNSLNNGTKFTLDGEELIAISSFNTDGFSIIDPACNKVVVHSVDIGISKQIEGASSLAFDGATAYIVMQHANRIASVTVSTIQSP